MSSNTPGAFDSDFPFQEWPVSYPNPYFQETSDNSEFLWIAQFSILFTGSIPLVTLEGCTPIDWNGYKSGSSIGVDIDGGVVLCGSGVMNTIQDETDYCTIPANNEFPLCDESTQNYLEENLTMDEHRTFILRFDNKMHLSWSTQFGTQGSNYATSVSTAGEYIFMGGYSFDNYTLLDFNEGSNLDYYRDQISGISLDAAITRFKTPSVVGVENQNTSSNLQDLFIYPNPTNTTLNIILPAYSGKDEMIEVRDALGKLINIQKLSNHILQFEINTAYLASGMYFIKYMTENDNFIKAFIKE